MALLQTQLTSAKTNSNNVLLKTEKDVYQGLITDDGSAAGDDSVVIELTTIGLGNYNIIVPKSHITSFQIIS